jgi:hypothetical protein
MYGVSLSIFLSGTWSWVSRVAGRYKSPITSVDGVVRVGGTSTAVRETSRPCELRPDAWNETSTNLRTRWPCSSDAVQILQLMNLW